MQHKLNLEAAAAYGRLFKFVINVEQDKFAQAFEEFLDAYDADKLFQLIKDAIEHANFNGDVEKFAKANGLKFDKQRESSQFSELYKRFIDNDDVKFFSARKQDDGSIEIYFEERPED